MRLLMINAPPELARELQRLSADINGLELMIADRNDPLVPGIGNAHFFPFTSVAKVDLSAIAKLRKLLHSFRPEVVHSFVPRALAQTVLASTCMRNPPKILSFYGITRVPLWGDPGNWITYLSPKIAHHTCESNAVKLALIAGGIKESKCEVIYNCVAESTAPKDRSELLSELKIATDRFVIGTVATIRPVKGIDLLLEALLRCSDLNNIIVVLIGPIQDPKVERLCEDPRLRDRIRVLGYIPEATSWMPCMDVFVMPSRSEGLCRALLEAMHQGICPVVSDAGGMKELVRNTTDGIVFPSEDSLALATAIRRLHGSKTLVQQYGNSARHRVAALCGARVVAERVTKLVQRVAAAA